jgi:glycosyltransferase involved in cell wall biosynthesis
MRIAIVSTFPPYRGGIAQFNLQLSLSLKDQGHDVMEVNWKRQYPSVFFPGKSQLIDGSNLETGPRALLDSLNPKSWRNTAEQVADWKPDLVLLPYWHAALVPALVGFVRRFRTIAPQAICTGLMHNASSHDAKWWDRWLTAKFIDRMDRIWTLSAQVTQRIQALHSNSPIRTLFHPVYGQYPALENMGDSRTALHLPSPTEADVILFFGLIRPYKGLPVLIEAMDLLKDRDRPVHLCIAGESYEDWSKYEKLIHQSTSRNRIQVHPRFILDDELSVFFGAATTVCLPYLQASQSGVTAIALHYGIPVVASDVGGLSEYITPSETGNLCIPGDAMALAKAIEDTLELHPFPIENFKEAQMKFSWSTFAEAAMKD